MRGLKTVRKAPAKRSGADPQYDDGILYWGATWLTIVDAGGPFTFKGGPKDFAALSHEWDTVVEACERDGIGQNLMLEHSQHYFKLRSGSSVFIGRVRTACPFLFDGSRLALTEGRNERPNKRGLHR